MWANLRSQLQTLLQSMVDGNGAAYFVEVSKAPKIRFSGYPSAHIVPSDAPGAYETNIENTRVYAFTVRLFYETKVIGIEKALENLESLVDTVMDTFDEEDLKAGSARTLGQNTPSKYTYINVFATTGKWGEYQDEELIMCEVQVRVQFSIDVS